MNSKIKIAILFLQLVCISLVTSNLIERKCRSNSECDEENECCYFPIVYPFQVSSEGYCQRYLNKGESCSWKVNCGCKPGLTCSHNMFSITCE